MLIKCPECNREISDQADNCPHCGHPINLAPKGPPQVRNVDRNAPIFLVISVVALGLSLFTPRLLLFFPIMGTLGSAGVSIVRKEKGLAGSIIVIVLGLGLLVLSESSLVAPGSIGNASNLDAAEIVQSNWRKDPTFGTRGTIKWNVQVKNKSDHNISSVRVEFTTFDKAGALVATTFTYISAIPPGQNRSESSFADLYGTEERAALRITSVRFSN
jgi:DNA-directed RNA polymerase subunit RPC12/RpoP